MVQHKNKSSGATPRMDPGQSAAGGMHQHRAARYEFAALLNYLLIRLMCRERFEVVFQAGTEDAQFVYPETADRPQITEWVQCKKKERDETVAAPRVVIPGWDGSWMGNTTRAEFLDEWLRQPLIDSLANDPNSRCSFLVYTRLDKRLETLIPAGVGTSANAYDAEVVASACPVDYAHPAVPRIGPKPLPGFDKVLQRSRIIPTLWEKRLQSYSVDILRGHFNVAKAHDLELILREKIASLAMMTHESNRSIGSESIRRQIEAETRGRGRWRDYDEFLSPRTALGRGQEEILSDLEVMQSNRLWIHDHFTNALTILLKQRSLIVCGPINCGKTTLCKYLLYQFKQRFPEADTYYLDLRSGGASTEEEIAFFAAYSNARVLFVIDDEQFDEDTARRLVNLHAHGRNDVHIVVVSNHTPAWRTESPLNDMDRIKFEDFSEPELIAFLDSPTPCVSRLTADQKNYIARAIEVTGGKIGAVAAIARLFHEAPGAPPTDGILTTERASQIVGQWLCAGLGIGLQAYRDEVIPVLLLAAHEIEMASGFARGHAATLARLGLVKLGDDGRLYPANRSIPMLVWQQMRRRLPDMVVAYLRDYGQDLTAVCSRLVADGVGRGAVRSLVGQKDLYLTEALRALFRRDPESFGTVLVAFRKAFGATSTKRLAQLVQQIVDERFLEDLFAYNRDRPIRLYTTLLELLPRLDGSLLRERFRALVGAEDDTPIRRRLADLLVSRLSATDVSLAEAFAFILTLRRCHSRLAELTLERFTASPAYARKKAILAQAADSVSQTVACCESLRRFSAPLFSAYADEFLARDRVVSLILAHRVPHNVFGILRRLRRVHARRAIEVLAAMWSEHDRWFTTALERSGGLTMAIPMVRAIASIDRRVAIAVCQEHAELLTRFVRVEPDQFKVGGSIRRVWSISRRTGVRLARGIDHRPMVDRLERERDRIVLGGPILSAYSEIAPGLALQIVLDTDAVPLYARVPRRQFVPGFSILTAGFLAARTAVDDGEARQRRDAFMADLMANSQITHLLRDGFAPHSEAPTAAIRDIACMISALSRHGLRMDDILRLVGIGRESFRERIPGWIEASANWIAVKELIYALSQVSSDALARLAIEAFLPTVGQHVGPGGKRAGDVQRRRPTEDDRPESVRLDSIGELLSIVAAVDEDAASDMVRRLDTESLVRACRNEINLGRQVSFLHGLYTVSRSRCLELATRAYDFDSAANDTLVRMLDENELPGNILHFIHSLQGMSQKAAHRIAELAGTACKDRIVTLVEASASLHLAAQWLRTLHAQGLGQTDFAKDIIRCMHVARTYDDRLFSNVEAAVAFQSVKAHREAGEFIDAVKRTTDQVNSVRSASALADLILRVIWIDQQAPTADCVGALLSRIGPPKITTVLSGSDDILSRCFLHWLLLHHVGDHATTLATALGDSVGELRHEAGRYRELSPRRMVSELLLGGRPDLMIARIAEAPPQRLAWLRPWELGLIDTMHSVAYGTGIGAAIAGRDLFGALGSDRTDCEEWHARHYWGDASNIKYALAIRSPIDVESVGLNRDKVWAEAAERARTEHRKGVKQLLDPAYSVNQLASTPYYLRVLLDETLRDRHRFDWLPRMLQDAEDRMFARSE